MKAGFEFVLGGILAVVFVTVLYLAVRLLGWACRRPSGLFFAAMALCVLLVALTSCGYDEPHHGPWYERQSPDGQQLWCFDTEGDRAVHTTCVDQRPA